MECICLTVVVVYTEVQTSTTSKAQPRKNLPIQVDRTYKAVLTSFTTVSIDSKPWVFIIVIDPFVRTCTCTVFFTPVFIISDVVVTWYIQQVIDTCITIVVYIVYSMSISHLSTCTEVLIVTASIQTDSLTSAFVTADDTSLVKSLVRQVHATTFVARRIRNIVLDAITIFIEASTTTIYIGVWQLQIITISCTIVQRATYIDQFTVEFWTILLVFI